MSDNQESKGEPRDLSLVELGAILVRRKYWFFLSAALIFVVLLIAYLQREEQAQYISLYQVPKTAEGKEIGEPEAVANQVAMNWSLDLAGDPRVTGKWKEIDLSASYDEDSSMIRIESTALASQRENVKEFHRSLLSNADRIFADAVDIRTKRIESQLARVNDTMAMLQDKSDASEAIVFAMEKKMQLHEKLDFLTSGNVVSIGYSPENVKGISAKALLLLGGVAALIIGIAVAFLVEFIARVRAKVRELSAESH